MAYQFKESKKKIVPINVYFDDKLFDLLKKIASFENTNKSKALNIFLKKGGDYETYKKNLHRQKCKKKAKNRVQEKQDFRQCLPYFQGDGYDSNLQAK